MLFFYADSKPVDFSATKLISESIQNKTFVFSVFAVNFISNTAQVISILIVGIILVIIFAVTAAIFYKNILSEAGNEFSQGLNSLVKRLDKPDLLQNMDKLTFPRQLSAIQNIIHAFQGVFQEEEKIFPAEEIFQKLNTAAANKILLFDQNHVHWQLAIKKYLQCLTTLFETIDGYEKKTLALLERFYPEEVLDQKQADQQKNELKNRIVTLFTELRKFKTTMEKTLQDLALTKLDKNLVNISKLEPADLNIDLQQKLDAEEKNLCKISGKVANFKISIDNIKSRISSLEKEITELSQSCKEEKSSLRRVFFSLTMREKFDMIDSSEKSIIQAQKDLITAKNRLFLTQENITKIKSVKEKAKRLVEKLSLRELTEIYAEVLPIVKNNFTKANTYAKFIQFFSEELEGINKKYDTYFPGILEEMQNNSLPFSTASNINFGKADIFQKLRILNNQASLIMRAEAKKTYGGQQPKFDAKQIAINVLMSIFAIILPIVIVGVCSNVCDVFARKLFNTNSLMVYPELLKRILEIDPNYYKAECGTNIPFLSEKMTHVSQNLLATFINLCIAVTVCSFGCLIGQVVVSTICKGDFHLNLSKEFLLLFMLQILMNGLYSVCLFYEKVGTSPKFQEVEDAEFSTLVLGNQLNHKPLEEVVESRLFWFSAALVCRTLCIFIFAILQFICLGVSLDLKSLLDLEINFVCSSSNNYLRLVSLIKYIVKNFSSIWKECNLFQEQEVVYKNLFEIFYDVFLFVSLLISSLILGEIAFSGIKNANDLFMKEYDSYELIKKEMMHMKYTQFNPNLRKLAADEQIKGYVLKIDSFSYPRKGPDGTIKYSEVLRNVSQVIGQGKHCFIGPTGAGKSTTMSIIAGFMQTYLADNQVFVVIENARGEESLCDIKYIDDESLRKKTVYLPQSISMPKQMTIGSLIRLVDKNLTSKEVEELCTMSGLFPEIEDLENRTLGSLSGGQNQRAFLALCAAILFTQDIKDQIFFDETYVGLDRPKRNKFYKSFFGEIDKDMAVRRKLLRNFEWTEKNCKSAFLGQERFAALSPVVWDACYKNSLPPAKEKESETGRTMVTHLMKEIMGMPDVGREVAKNAKKRDSAYRINNKNIWEIFAKEIGPDVYKEHLNIESNKSLDEFIESMLVESEA